MKRLTCPLNGSRNISEFIYGGEYHADVNPDDVGDREWAEHVFFHENEAGLVIEWWCHSASSCWFLAKRDTRSDEILDTFHFDALMPSSDGV